MNGDTNKQLVDPLWKCVEGDRLNPLITFRGHVALIATKEVIRRENATLIDDARSYSESRDKRLDRMAQDVRDLTDVICEALEHRQAGDPKGRP